MLIVFSKIKIVIDLKFERSIIRNKLELFFELEKMNLYIFNISAVLN